jgi:hypothetical protein
MSFWQISAHPKQETKRAIAREEQERTNRGRFAGKLLVAAAAIAAVRLIRDDISSPTPRL